MHLNFPNRPSQDRKPLVAPRGVVATSQPLAAQAGLAILQRGGNAVDAILATAITLTVVEPTANDIGGDTFALVWDGTQLHGLNGSGRAPAAHTAEKIRQRGHEQMPLYGWLSVTVPGAPAAWRDLHARFGKLPFEDLFETAIFYAENGFPVSPTVANNWNNQVELIHTQLHGPEYEHYKNVFCIDGRAPRPGEVWRNPEAAQTLHRIAETKAEAFYHGEIAQAIAEFSQKTGGLIIAEDLARHSSTWVDPISVNYRGYDVWEIPPNGQGLTALIALNILEGFDLAALPYHSDQRYHLQMESIKLAFADAFRYIADPAQVAVPTEELLSKAYAARRRTLITDTAGIPEPGDPVQGGTVYLCATDKDGMMVSLIQSTYHGFGSHVVIPGGGFALQNRGNGFSLDPNHPNCIAPQKRPFHTIIPGFLTANGEAIGPFGVMGGHMQPQGHVQMVVNTIDYQLNPQASLDAPRWYYVMDRNIKVEPSIPEEVVNALKARGHEIDIEPLVGTYGRGQIIWRMPSGIYVAGSEGRTDGYAAGY